MTILIRLALAVAFLLFSIASAFAQATTITIPTGEWVGYALPIGAFIIMVLLIMALGYLIRLLPPWAQALVSVQVQKQLIGYAANALNLGVQKVREATKESTLTIDVGNKVIAAAAQEAINTWPKNVVDRLGGIEGIKKWLLTQAEDHGVILDPKTTAADILNSPAVSAITGETAPNPQ